MQLYQLDSYNNRKVVQHKNVKNTAKSSYKYNRTHSEYIANTIDQRNETYYPYI